MFFKKKQTNVGPDDVAEALEKIRESLGNVGTGTVSLATVEETRAQLAQRIQNLAVGDVLTQKAENRMYCVPAPGDKVVVYAVCPPTPDRDSNHIIDFAFLAKRNGSPWQVIWCDSSQFTRIFE